jgi:hypothetical protein
MRLTTLSPLALAAALGATALVLGSDAFPVARTSQRASTAATAPSFAATADDPVFTTYAAPLARSEYLVDEAYHLRFYDPDDPLSLTTDTAGRFGVGFVLGGQVVHRIGDYARAPVVRRSYANLVRFDFDPFAGIQIDATFSVHSSRAAVLILSMSNASGRPVDLGCYGFALAPDDPFPAARITPEHDGLIFGHSEPRGAWSESPTPEYDNIFRDLLLFDRPADTWAAYPAGDAALLKELRGGQLNGDLSGRGRALALRTHVELKPGGRAVIRLTRAVAPTHEDEARLVASGRALGSLDPAALEAEAAAPYRDLPRLSLPPERALILQGALSLVRQNMMPAEGRTRFNYYVFSREPVWSWGHDGQVFHESLSMLAYAWMDPWSAMDSQRVFMEAQDPDGYLPYRVGPYVVRTFPLNGEKTTSAPFFSWTNWEVYRVASTLARAGRGGVREQDTRRFLEDAYRAGGRFADYLTTHRDKDHDGLLEWGGNAVLECVRDSQVPIWDLLGKNDDSAPSKLEALDLNSMMVKEQRALADMARELGHTDEASRWGSRADTLAAAINRTMWDPQTRFYYSVDRETHKFVTPGGLDLRRMEIIGFLPLWAGITSPEQTEALVAHLTNPQKFWRRFGVPTLSADDPGYQPFITRCCQWNGAVWLEWNYLVFDGLRSHGRRDLAADLGGKMIEAAATQLRRTHRFWESYSPDQYKLESPMNYIWDSVLASVIIELARDEGRGARNEERGTRN